MQAAHTAQLALLDGLFIAGMQLLDPNLDSCGTTAYPDLGFSRPMALCQRFFNPDKPRQRLAVENTS
jgi:hypothetical protein